MKHRSLLVALLVLCLTLTLLSSCDSPKEENFDQTGHEHNYLDANCTQPRTCECGLTKGSALGHSYRSATCTTPQICERCGNIATVALGHNFSDATCTSPQICRRCEAIQGSPVGHNYLEATCLEPQICSYCNNSKGSPLGHTYSNDICIRCNQVDPESLPVTLGELHIIDMSSTYESGWNDGTLVDSFGDSYNGYFLYSNVDLGSGITSIHNLNGKYTTFSGGIVCSQETDGESYMVVHIYVDGVLKYTSPTFDKTTGKINFSVDVSGGRKLTIHAAKVTSRYSWASHLAIVETKLSKQ